MRLVGRAPAILTAAFSAASGAAVPEPSTWAMMLVALRAQGKARKAAGGLSLADARPINSLRHEIDRAMTRGRKPLGDKALTAAERAARYRAAHADGASRDTPARLRGLRAATQRKGRTPDLD